MVKKILNRQSLLARKLIKTMECDLPGGGTVLMRIPSGADWRKHQSSLRDKNGDVIDTRAERVDELLIATILVDEDGNQMFSVDDVMQGCFDNPNISAADINVMSTKALELYGRISSSQLQLSDEDREKNSSGTAQSE